MYYKSEKLGPIQNVHCNILIDGSTCIYKNIINDVPHYFYLLKIAISDILVFFLASSVYQITIWLCVSQDAGWLTGMKESEWSQLGADAHKGLFPENFTQRLD